jgi:hypothetical protein
MIKKSKAITVRYPVSSVYQYLTNIEHYAHHFGSACKVEQDGLVATIEAPLIGQIRTVITERIVDTKVIMSAKKIGTTLTADLDELSESETKIKLSMMVNPDLGFVKNKSIELLAPKALDMVIDELVTTDFEE